MVPNVAHLIGNAQEALLLAVAVSLPVVGAAAIIGLFVAVMQAATQVQDITIAHLPWMGAQIAAFAARVFGGS
jgi:type III secretory pathway component EscS